MKKSFDFVLDDLIENSSLKDLEKLFSSLKIKNVFVLREINKKEDLSFDFQVPKSSKINFYKAYLLKDPQLFHLYNKKEIVLVNSGSLKNNSVISNHKKIFFLKDPFSKKLCFDEQNARSCYQNKKKVVFNVNLLRDADVNYLKQFNFIIFLLKLHRVDMVFSSFAKTKEELVDYKILSSFLKNFNLEESIINRFLSKDILKTD